MRKETTEKFVLVTSKRSEGERREEIIRERGQGERNVRKSKDRFSKNYKFSLFCF